MKFNLSHDVHAANVVMASRIPLWQVPQNDDNAHRWPRSECWSLGDFPAVSLILDDLEYSDGFVTMPAPRITPEMHYVHHQTERLI